MDLRLVAYTPLGPRLTVLPDALTFTVTMPFGADLPVVKIEYTKYGRKHPVLETLPEVAVEWWDGAAWIEPSDARFHVVKRSWNSKDDGGSVRSYDAIHVGWLCRRARVWTGTNMNSEGQRQFNAATPGTIVGTIFNDAQGRGWGPNLSRSFTDAVDSAGQPWTEATHVTLAFDPSADLDSVLAAVVDQGLADVRWTGRTLDLFNPGTTLGRDLTTGTVPVWIRHSDGITSAPEEGTIEDLVTAARLVGDAGSTWDVTNPGARQTYGRLEAYVTQSGVKDEGTAALLIEQQLVAGQDERVQYTREFDTAASRVWPWRNYRGGDWVYVDREVADKIERHRSRVVQVSLTKDADGVSGHVTLGTRLDDLITRLARRTRSVTGGSTGTGGTGSTPTPETPDVDSRVPETVQGLVGSSAPYLDSSGNARAVGSLDWADVTTDIEGQILTVRGYEVWGRQIGDKWAQITTTVASDLAWSPFEPETVWQFRVRAISNTYVAGGWSAEITVEMDRDLTPPPKPSAPVLTSRLGTVTVAWDGKTSTGTDMPMDFDRCDVNVLGTGAPSVVDANFLGSVRRNAGFDTLLLAEGVPETEDGTVEVYLVAYDRSGNASEPSAVTSIEVQRIVGDDIEPASIKTNHILVGALDGMVITGALLRTAASGQRVELTSGRGLVGYGADGATVKTQVDAATGRLSAVDASISGTLDVIDSTGTGLRCYVNDLGGVTSFQYQGVAAGEIAAVTTGFLAVNGVRAARLAGDTAGVTVGKDDGVNPRVMISAGRAAFGSDPQVNGNIQLASIGTGSTTYVQSQNVVQLTATNQIRLNSNASITCDAGTSFSGTCVGNYLWTTEAQYYVRTGGVTTANAMLLTTAGVVQFGRHSTTTNTANVNMSSSGTLARVSSRRDSKLVPEVMPIDVVRSLLDVDVLTWFDRAAAEGLAEHLSDPEDDADNPESPVYGVDILRRIPGLIAEDVEAAGASQFVIYGEGGRVEGLMYDRIGVAWIPMVRELVERIERLENNHGD